MAGLLPVPVIQKEAWAQCENPNCGKWRRLPPGVAINENEPWYCYMNPDFARNTCSASEVDYDENNELVIDGADDPEEAARNREIMEKLEASIAAAAAAARGRGRGRGRGRPRGSGRGRGRPPLSGRGRGYSGPPSDFGGGGGGGRRGGRSVSFLDDFEEDGSDSDGGARASARMSRRQVAKQLQRVLDCQGQWDAPRGVDAAGPSLPSALPAEAWEALSTAVPEAAELACEAADLASSVRYFEGAGSDAAAAAAVAEEVGTLARLGTMMAAASGLAECQDVLTRIEREQLGLEDAPPLPDPTQPLPAIVPMEAEPLPVPAAAARPPLPMPSPQGAGMPPQPQAMPFLPPGMALPPGVAMNPMALAMMQQMLAAQAAQQAQQQQKMAAQSSFAPQ